MEQRLVVQVWEPQRAKAFLGVDTMGQFFLLAAVQFLDQLIEVTVPLVLVDQQSFPKIPFCQNSLVLA
jgi:hypothetical protein